MLLAVGAVCGDGYVSRLDLRGAVQSAESARVAANFVRINSSITDWDFRSFFVRMLHLLASSHRYFLCIVPILQ